MPQLFNDGLDDQLIIDESPLFNGGQVSYARPAVLAVNELSQLVNADISASGKITTRRGSLLIGPGSTLNDPIQGMGFYNTLADADLVAVVNGAFRVWNGVTWLTKSGLVMNATLPVQFVQGNNLMWLAQSGFLLHYWDGTAVIAPFTGGNTLAPIRPSLIEWHTNRLVSAGMLGQPDTVSFSEYLLNLADLGNNIGWDHANWDLRVGAGDGDSITGLRSWTNHNLVVFKEHSTWVINCDPNLVISDPNSSVSLFIISPVHHRIGCMAPNSAQQVGADIFFLSTSGIRSVGRTIASENQFDIGPPLSQPITDIIDRINPSAVGTVCAAYWNNRYLCALPVDSATYPNLTVVYNTLINSWSGYWTNWTPTAFTRRLDGDTAKLCFGQSDGSVTDFLDYVRDEVAATFKDKTTEIPTTILSRAFTCQDRQSAKTGLFANIEFEQSTDGVTVSAVLDGRATAFPLSDGVTTFVNSIVLPFILPAVLPDGGIVSKALDLMAVGRWRECQLLVETEAGKLSLNTMGVGAFVEPLEIQR